MQALSLPASPSRAPEFLEVRHTAPEPADYSFKNELRSAVNRSSDRSASERPSGASGEDPRPKPSSGASQPDRPDADDASDGAPGAETSGPAEAQDKPTETEGSSAPSGESDGPGPDSGGGDANAGAGEQKADSSGTAVDAGTAMTALLGAQGASVAGSVGGQTGETTVVEPVAVTGTATTPAAAQTTPSTNSQQLASTVPTGSAEGEGAEAQPSSQAATDGGSGGEGDGQTNSGNGDLQPKQWLPQTEQESSNQPAASTDSQPAPAATRAEMVGSAVPLDEARKSDERLEGRVVEATDAPETSGRVVAPAPASTEQDNLALEVAKALAALQAGEESGEKAADTAESKPVVPVGGAQTEGAGASVVGGVENAPAQVESRPSVAAGTAVGEAGKPTGLEAPAGDPKLDEITRIVSANVGTRNASVRLQLDPPSLGQMQIDVRVRQEAMTLRIQVETEAALGRIQATASQLKQALETHGLVVDRFEVQLRGSDSTSARSDHNGGDDPRFSDTQQTFGESRSETGSSASDGGDRFADPEQQAGSGETAESEDAPGAAGVLTASSVDLLA